MRIKLVSAMLLLAVGVAPVAIAADKYPKKAYDATYEMVGSTGSSTVRMGSDGKGKTLMESSSGTYKTTTISDYNAKKATSLLHAQKMMTVMPFDPDASATDEESMKKKNAKSLGVKMVAGRNCKGWSYAFKGGDSEVWSDVSGDFLVKSTTNSSGTKTTMTLKSIKDGAPPAAAFAIPADYKKIGQ
ncbi:MAG: DUF4412 domain-containing protein [Candidatus Obscuribacterales bacterium]|nr:DUF4412 domain-containing protein [Candidatus Obscuribacterales bacterium]